MMNFCSSNYPAWSTADEQSNFNTVTMSGNLNSNLSLNASDVPAWDFQEAISQVDYKPGFETGSATSGGGCDSMEPAWANSTATWDHESATRLAEQLLKFQMDPTSYNHADDQKENMSVCSMSESQSKIGHPYAAPSGVPNPRFKTEFCRNFREKGDCVYGSQCQFAHGKAELRHDMIRHSKYKTKLCQKYWINGWCAYGTRCNFIHQEEEVQQIEKGRINLNQVGFRPLIAGRNLRKSSESSADSGIDPGLVRSGIEQPGPRSNLEFCGRMNKTESKLEPTVKSFHPSIINYNNMVNENKNDLMNMNLATELNRNLYLDIVKVKEKRVVPHPEDNPIPVSGPGARFNSDENPISGGLATRADSGLTSMWSC
eukprot:TRINITY_DN8504_c0_g1_i1.p1 TRINITY_DN8504_c0_g1~~TRINITY_DN8504_c0_g1_i1.p1  ORF type:complete len:372 (-),score=92.33 TRINITY_DN8504_c0_g1_i1:207-1322(-)